MGPLVVLCHPFERSYCHAIADALVEGAGASTPADGSRPVCHDLYAEGVDPVLTGAEIARRFSLDDRIQAYSEEVRTAGAVCIVHPDWWSAPPALLKGWIERVFRPGIAYDWQGEEFEEKHHVPLLTGTRLAVFVTTDRPADDPPKAIEAFWRDAAAYSGMELIRYTLFPDLRHSGYRTRRAWLADVRAFAAEALVSGGRDD